MERVRIKSQRRTPRAVTVPLFAALGLMAIAGCGSSDSKGSRDSSTDLSGGKTIDTNPAQRGDVLPASGEVSLAEVKVQPEVGIDGPKVLVDGPQTPDLTPDKPIALDGGPDSMPDVPNTGIDTGNLPETNPGKLEVEPVSDDAPAADAPEPIGGAGGTGGAGGAGGAGGTGGATTASALMGWPQTSVDSPYVFGPINCAGAPQLAPAAYTFTVKNTTNTTGKITDVTFSGSAGFTTDLATSLTLAAGESKTVTINAPAIAFPLTPAAASSFLTVTTDEVTNNVYTIYLAEVVHGARLAWGTGAVTTYLGGSGPGGLLTQEFNVLNTGDQATTIDITSSDPNFTISAPNTAITIAAGGKVTRTLSITAPTVQGTYSTSVGLVASGTSNLCAPAPDKWTATAMSLIGYPTVTPGSGTPLYFSAACGTTPDPKTITIKNVGTAGLTWKEALTAPSLDHGPNPTCFTITRLDNVEIDADANALAVNDSVTLKISADAILGTESSRCTNLLKLDFTNANGALPTQNYTLVATPLGDRLTFDLSSQADFTNQVLTVDPQPAVSKNFTVTNNGFSDPLGSDTVANVTLTLSNSQYSFSATGSETSKTVAVDADGGQVTGKVYYRRQQLGPYSATSDDGNLNWTIGNSDKTCMCNPGHQPHVSNCGKGGQGPAITGSVVEGIVNHTFVDQRTDFGTVFCGDTAAPRTYRVTNVGTGTGNTFQITAASLASTSHFTLTHPGVTLPITLAKDAYADFIVTPKMIDPADVTGHADLGGGSNKFSTTLNITTTAPVPASNPVTAVTISEPIQMWAQGIIIAAAVDSDWTYDQINWSYDAANFTTSNLRHLTKPVNNQGNVNAQVTLATVPGTDDMFKLSSPPAIITPAQGSTYAVIDSIFGPFPNCDTINHNFHNTGTLSIQAVGAPGGMGICQVDNHVSGGTWTQGVSLTGTLNMPSVESRCGTGQRCDAIAQSADHGYCICDNDPSSCQLTGCCSMRRDGVCVPYASQNSLKDGSHAGCGLGGSTCNQCDDAANATCTAGTCTCNGGETYCPNEGPGSTCFDLQTNVNKCGSCDHGCPTNNITPTCTDGACGGNCASGWANCDSSKPTNGCNVNTNTDSLHCGGCGIACSSGQICSGGSCACDPTACNAANGGCCTGGLGGSCVAGTANNACGSAGANCTDCLTGVCDAQTRTCNSTH